MVQQVLPESNVEHENKTATQVLSLMIANITDNNTYKYGAKIIYRY